MICPFEFPSLGGAEMLTYELAKSLANSNEIFILSLSSKSASEQIDFKDKNLHVFPILKYGKFSLIKNFFTVFKFLVRVRCDVVHAQYVFPSALWGLAGKILRIPVVVTSHGVDIQKDKSIGYGMRLYRSLAMYIWLTLKLIDIHIVVSKSMVKDAIEAGSNPSKIQVVYNGIDTRKASLLGDIETVEKYGIHKEDFVILYLGRLHPKKSLEDLVKAFPRVVQKVPNAKLVIAGKGSEEAKLKKLVEELKLQGKVIFTGFVSENEKWSLLKRCDVFVLPSIVEAFGIALIEAMACGKPVIATRVGPFPEIIKNGETGILVPAHSPSDLADAIINLAQDPEKRMLIGKKAKEEVENRFDIRKIANDYLKVYNMVVKGRKCLFKMYENRGTNLMQIRK
ncbi:MAG: glycosyltransferase family 4 protein [Candidatus Verstraetearchaeota archaeon]|nr:glycosyltransferase family 4 protein [Candidatus Verstraetearchaeota archaeon]